MKKTVRALLCAAVIVISGCSSGNGEQSGIRFVDAGGHSVSDSSTVTSDADSNEEYTVGGMHESTAETGTMNDFKPSEPNESAESRGESASTSDVTGTSAVTSGTPAKTDEPKPQTTQPATTITTDPPATAVTEPPQTTAAENAPAATTTETAAERIPTDEPPEIPTVSVGANSYQTLNYSDIKGIWISYIELSEMLTGQSESAFRRNIGAAYDNIAELGLNTVYVHVRSHGDAYYASELFPPSKYGSGTLGKAPDFDPLEIMIEEAHERDLSFQAWINPLRCCTVSELSAVSGYKIYDLADGKRAVAVNGTYYLNPAYEEVIEYIAQGAAEIAANYDVDGLHIDDYFYPTTDSSFDSAAYSQSGFETISSFRLANCDKLVSGIYGAVKSANSGAVFSVSCQGSIENNYNQMYADVKKWCTQAGYLDYVMPQIYYGFNNSAQPYEVCTSRWNEIAQAGGIPLVVGLSVSKVGLEDTWAGVGKTEWITDENILARQIRYALELRSYGGVCLYSYRSVFAPEAGVKAQVEEEISAVRGLLSES
ncbi:MAG: family 10 glycosylhydrolase [Oscillospiraceae bacterium]|nr:family 10 glycosylhydrolase [Oscillospiraceae bacterium]